MSTQSVRLLLAHRAVSLDEQRLRADATGSGSTKVPSALEVTMTLPDESVFRVRVGCSYEKPFVTSEKQPNEGVSKWLRFVNPAILKAAGNTIAPVLFMPATDIHQWRVPESFVPDTLLSKFRSKLLPRNTTVLSPYNIFELANKTYEVQKSNYLQMGRPKVETEWICRSAQFGLLCYPWGSYVLDDETFAAFLFPPISFATMFIRIGSLLLHCALKGTIPRLDYAPGVYTSEFVDVLLHCVPYKGSLATPKGEYLWDPRRLQSKNLKSTSKRKVLTAAPLELGTKGGKVSETEKADLKRFRQQRFIFVDTEREALIKQLKENAGKSQRLTRAERDLLADTGSISFTPFLDYEDPLIYVISMDPAGKVELKEELSELEVKKRSDELLKYRMTKSASSGEPVFYTSREAIMRDYCKRFEIPLVPTPELAVQSVIAKAIAAKSRKMQLARGGDFDNPKVAALSLKFLSDKWKAAKTDQQMLQDQLDSVASDTKGKQSVGFAAQDGEAFVEEEYPVDMAVEQLAQQCFTQHLAILQLVPQVTETAVREKDFEILKLLNEEQSSFDKIDFENFEMSVPVALDYLRRFDHCFGTIQPDVGSCNAVVPGYEEDLVDFDYVEGRPIEYLYSNETIFKEFETDDMYFGNTCKPIRFCGFHCYLPDLCSRSVRKCWSSICQEEHNAFVHSLNGNMSTTFRPLARESKGGPKRRQTAYQYPGMERQVYTVQSFEISLQELPAPPEGFEPLSDQRITSLKRSIQSAIHFLKTAENPHNVLGKERSRQLIHDLLIGPTTGLVPGTPVSANITTVTVERVEPNQEQTAQIVSDFTVKGVKDSTIHTTKCSLKTIPFDPDFVVLEINFQMVCPKYDVGDPQFGLVERKRFYRGLNTTPSTIKVNRELAQTLYLLESGAIHSVAKHVPYTRGDFSIFAQKVRENCMKNRPTSGTILGQLNRFLQCNVVSLETTVPPVDILRDSVSALKLETHLDLTSLTPRALLHLARSPHFATLNRGSSTGFINGDLKRNSAVAFADAIQACTLFECWLKDKEAAQAAFDEWRTFEAKAKFEVQPIAKFYNKTRSIFVAPGASQLLCSAMFSESEDALKKIANQSTGGYLLGCDPPTFLRNFISWLRSDSRPSKVVWFVYSDNIYGFDPSTNLFYSFDAVKCEACVKPETIRALFVSLFDNYVKQARTVSVYFDDFITDDVFKQVYDVLMVDDKPIYQFKTATGQPTASSHLVLNVMSNLRFRDLNTPSFVSMSGGMQFTSYKIEHDEDQATIIVLTDDRNRTIPDWVAWYGNQFVPSCLTDGRALFIDQTFRMKFLPSGLRLTTLANSVTSMSVVKQFELTGKPISDFAVNWQPSFMKLEKTSVTDITPLINRQPGPELLLDFLGLNATWFAGSWHYVLRQESLYSNPFFHKAYAAPLDMKASINRVSVMMAALLNGAIVDPCYTSLIIADMARERCSVYDAELVASYIEEADVPASILTQKEFFWQAFYAFALDRIADDPNASELAHYRSQVLGAVKDLLSLQILTTDIPLYDQYITGRYLSEVSSVAEDEVVPVTVRFVREGFQGGALWGRPVGDWCVVIRTLVHALYNARQLLQAQAANLVSQAFAQLGEQKIIPQYKSEDWYLAVFDDDFEIVVADQK